MAAFIKLALFVSVLGAMHFVRLVESAGGTTHKPRNNAQLYKEFKKLEDNLLKADLVTGTKGCQYLKGLHRVNGTRFFIYDSLNRKDIETNFTVGRQFCENLKQRGGQWRLAQINNLRTFRMLTLQIEETSFNYSHVDGTGYMDSWFIEFGYKGFGIYRSTYKQQYGQHICQTPDKVKEGVDYEIFFDTLEYSNVTVQELDTKVQFYYDYLETYWVVDHKLPEEDWFQYATQDEEESWVSEAYRNKKATGDEIAFERELHKVNCLEWHFYLCGPEPFEAWVHEEL